MMKSLSINRFHEIQMGAILLLFSEKFSQGELLIENNFRKNTQFKISIYSMESGLNTGHGVKASDIQDGRANQRLMSGKF